MSGNTSGIFVTRCGRILPAHDGGEGRPVSQCRDQARRFYPAFIYGDEVNLSWKLIQNGDPFPLARWRRGLDRMPNASASSPDYLALVTEDEVNRMGKRIFLFFGYTSYD